MRTIQAFSFLLSSALFCSIISCANEYSDLGDGLFAKIETSRGDIVLRLEYEKTPLTVCNFVGLAEGKLDASLGKPFYDGLTFHRVEPGFVIQGGDPLGSGAGGPGYSFSDEIHKMLRHDGPGVLSMANAGANTNGSQFFITLDAAPHLDDKHSVFGRVISGMDVVNNISVGDIMKKVLIIRNGAAAKEFIADQAMFNSLSKRVIELAQQAVREKREADLALVNQKWPSATQTENGISYLVLKSGTGNKPKKGEIVITQYKGMFLNGTIFDASDYHGGTFEFQVGIGAVIRGWDLSIIDMRVGEKRLLILPPEFAYGERGAGGVIPPNTFLVFEMELIAIK